MPSSSTASGPPAGGRPPRLQRRIARSIALTVAVGLLFGVLGLIVMRHHLLRRSMEASATTYATLLAQPLASAAQLYRTSGRDVLGRQIEGWLRLSPDVVTIEVVDVSGRVMMRVDGGEVTTFSVSEEAPVVADPALLDAVCALEPSAALVRDHAGRRVYRVVAPVVEAWGRHSDSVVATFGYSRVDRQLLESIVLAALLFAVAMLLANRVATGLADSITRSLGRLQAGVRRIREGHLEERVVAGSDDEISDLADAFNATAAELGTMIERLREANRELEALDQTKADLLANISHELKTPLTALKGYVELLGGGGLGELTEGAAHAVAVCRANLERLEGRIEELVQVGRLERGAADELEVEPVHVGWLLHGVVEALLPRLEERGIFCSLDLASELPTVAGSPEHLERVFSNLLDNAGKFTPEDGRITVTVRGEERDRREGVLVMVADTGIGIPEAARLRVFDRFYQVDPSARRKYGGMGLGLAVVRSVVEAHGGSVWVESGPGRGSTFSVWLPCGGAEHGGGDPEVDPGVGRVVGEDRTTPEDG